MKSSLSMMMSSNIEERELKLYSQNSNLKNMLLLRCWRDKRETIVSAHFDNNSLNKKSHLKSASFAKSSSQMK